MDIIIPYQDWAPEVPHRDLDGPVADVLAQFRPPGWQLNCEMARRAIINLLLIAAQCVTESKVGLFCEISTKGKIGPNIASKGSIDYIVGSLSHVAVKNPDVMVGVVEAKDVGAIRTHMKQFFGELRVVFRKGRRFGVQKVFGVLTDGESWYFARCSSEPMIDISVEIRDVNTAFSWLCFLFPLMATELARSNEN